MATDADLHHDTITSDDDHSTSAGQASERGTIVPQFALDAADAKIASFSAAVADTADEIDRLVSAETVPETLRDVVTSVTHKLRQLGAASGDVEAAELVSGLQRTAAAHPATSIGVGAAIGAALATLIVKLGAPAKASPASEAAT